MGEQADQDIDLMMQADDNQTPPKSTTAQYVEIIKTALYPLSWTEYRQYKGAMEALTALAQRVEDVESEKMTWFKEANRIYGMLLELSGLEPEDAGYEKCIEQIQADLDQARQERDEAREDARRNWRCWQDAEDAIQRAKQAGHNLPDAERKIIQLRTERVTLQHDLARVREAITTFFVGIEFQRRNSTVDGFEYWSPAGLMIDTEKLAALKASAAGEGA